MGNEPSAVGDLKKKEIKIDMPLNTIQTKKCSFYLKFAANITTNKKLAFSTKYQKII